jgi:peptidoglycan/LPS O-acetylase OafA/YrhL
MDLLPHQRTERPTVEATPRTALEQAGGEHFPVLTSLRFLAAFYVVLFHTYPWLRARPEGTIARLWQTFCGHGFVAVGFFFTLSGFILAHNYSPQRAYLVRDFYRARFARVYPVYLLGIGAGLPILLIHALRDGNFSGAALELFVALSLTQAWLPTLWNAVNVPGWSLSVEAFFYLCFPSLSRSLARHALDRPRAFGLLAGLVVVALLPASLGMLHSDTGLPMSDLSVVANTLRYNPALALPEFAFGIVLARVHALGFARAHVVRWLSWPALVLLGIALTSDLVPYMLLHNGALLPVLSVLILRAADGREVWRPLRHPTLLLLGEASYALYILHLMVFIYVKTALERLGIDPLASWVFPCQASLSVLLSLACHRWFERPARARLLTLSSLRSATFVRS